MANHALPTTDSLYVDYTAELKARDEDIARQFDPAYTSSTNVLTHTYRLNSAAAKWQRWNGTSWVDAVAVYAITISGNAGTATKLATARTIGGVSFDGTADINLPGVNTAGNQNTSGNAATATVAASCSGNAATASSVAWTGVTGRPTAVSAFTNDAGYQTSTGSVAYAATAGNGGVTSVNGQTGAVTVSLSTANVLNATAGATVGAVGTYAMLRNYGVQGHIEPGTVVAGANLYYASATGTEARSVPVGSNWLCMGHAMGTLLAQSLGDRTTLFLRVS